jgi:hypothetical protein
MMQIRREGRLSDPEVYNVWATASHRRSGGRVAGISILGGIWVGMVVHRQVQYGDGEGVLVYNVWATASHKEIWR